MANEMNLEAAFNAWWEKASQSWTASDGEMTRDVAHAAFLAGGAQMPNENQQRVVFVRGIVLEKKDSSGNPLVRIGNDEIYVQPAFIVQPVAATNGEPDDEITVTTAKGTVVYRLASFSRAGKEST